MKQKNEAGAYLVGTSGDIGITSASTASPPANARVGGLGGVTGAASVDRERNVGDVNASCINFSDPLLNKRAIDRRNHVERRVAHRWREAPCGSTVSIERNDRTNEWEHT